MAPLEAKALDLLPTGQRTKLLLRLLRQPGERQVRRLVGRVHPADMARLFPLLRPGERSRLLDLLFEMRLAAPTLRELEGELQRQVLSEFSDSRLAVVLGRLPADDAVDLLDQLEPGRRDQLLSTMDSTLAARLHNLMLYGETTAGGLMDPDVVFFGAEQSVADTLEVLRGLAEEQRLFYLYVTDDRGHLIGLVTLWGLLTAASSKSLREVMSTEVLSVQVDTPQEEVARLFSRYDLLMVPVVDQDARLVGAITVDDVLDVVEEEASSDLYRLGHLPVQESLATPVVRSLRLRLPVLLASLGAALVAAWVISRFEPVLARYALLAAFMPVIAATAGQAATQTLTVMVGSLATEDLHLREAGRVVARQLGIGLLEGLATGTLLAVVAWLWEGRWLLSLILLCAQTLSFALSALLAALIPLILRRSGLDPAHGSATAVTAVADLAGFSLFLGLASLLIDRLL